MKWPFIFKTDEQIFWGHRFLGKSTLFHCYSSQAIRKVLWRGSLLRHDSLIRQRRKAKLCFVEKQGCVPKEIITPSHDSCMATWANHTKRWRWRSVLCKDWILSLQYRQQIPSLDYRPSTLLLFFVLRWHSGASKCSNLPSFLVSNLNF